MTVFVDPAAIALRSADGAGLWSADPAGPVSVMAPDGSLLASDDEPLTLSPGAAGSVALSGLLEGDPAVLAGAVLRCEVQVDLKARGPLSYGATRTAVAVVPLAGPAGGPLPGTHPERATALDVNHHVRHERIGTGPGEGELDEAALRRAEAQHLGPTVPSRPGLEQVRTLGACRARAHRSDLEVPPLPQQRREHAGGPPGAASCPSALPGSLGDRRTSMLMNGWFWPALLDTSSPRLGPCNVIALCSGSHVPD